MDFEEQLTNHLAVFPSSPILFIGSGLSRRYLGLDDWEGLLRRFCELTQKSFNYYKSTANGSLPLAASELAKDFNPIWFSEPDYKESRKVFEEQCDKIDSPLKYEISRYIIDMSTPQHLPKDLEEEIDLLSKAVIDGIITTNWDIFLESLFDKSKTFIGQDELIFGNPQGISEIYKIHGSAETPNSLVLTEEDYNDFEERNAYLASKLLTIFVEHPIIFIGYSLSDSNIQRIIKEIIKCIPRDKADELRDRFIFIEYTPGQEPKLENSTYHVGTTPIIIKQIKTESFKEIFSALASLRRRFPAHILRQLKEQVYDLVVHNDPQGKLFVKDIDGQEEDKPKEVVFGVGAISKMQATGYKGLDRLDLIRDFVFETNDYDAFSVVDDTLKKICKGNAHIPVFKYLKSANYINERGQLNAPYYAIKGINDRFNVSPDTFRPKGYLKNQADKLDVANNKLADIERAEGPETMVKLATFKDPGAIDLKYLRDFMKSHFEEYTKATHMSSHFCKLACYMDYIENYWNIYVRDKN